MKTQRLKLYFVDFLLILLLRFKSFDERLEQLKMLLKKNRRQCVKQTLGENGAGILHRLNVLGSLLLSIKGKN